LVWSYAFDSVSNTGCTDLIQTSESSFIVAGWKSKDGSDDDFWLANVTVLPESAPQVNPLVPGDLAVSAAYPSPFNSSAFVNFSTPYAGAVRISLMDMNGREWTKWTESVAAPGEGRVRIDGSGLASGAYMLRLEQGGRVGTMRVLLVR